MQLLHRLLQPPVQNPKGKNQRHDEKAQGVIENTQPFRLAFKKLLSIMEFFCINNDYMVLFVPLHVKTEEFPQGAQTYICAAVYRVIGKRHVNPVNVQRELIFREDRAFPLIYIHYPVLFVPLHIEAQVIPNDLQNPVCGIIG